ncbi:hypothetical protein [Pseudosporangium ferrugineum]|nr:hypothetical protein [Pseudosporangium ferrugineum]
MSAMQPGNPAPKLQQQAAQLSQLAQGLAAATPQRTEGSDATGWVRVSLGPDGAPTDIRVRDGWRQRIAPEALAAAVLDANRDAVRRAMESWIDALDQQRWWRRRADVDEFAGEAGQSDLPAPPHGLTRDVNDVAEEAITELQGAQRSASAPADQEHEGADDGRHVVVRVGQGGLLACDIVPRWAEREEGSAVSAALSVALKRARPEPPPPPSSSRADDLVADALATLLSMTANPTTRNGDQ